MPLQINTSSAYVVKINLPVKNPGLEYSTHIWRADEAHRARQDSGHVHSKRLLNWSWPKSCHLLKQSAPERVQPESMGFLQPFFKIHHETITAECSTLTFFIALLYVWGSISVLVGGGQVEITWLTNPPILSFPFGWLVVVGSVWSGSHLGAGTKEGVRSLDWCFELG